LPSIDFGRTEVGVVTGAFSWTITNTGPGPTGALVISNDDPVQIQAAHSCGSALPPGGRCVVSVSFKPIVSGIAQRTLVASATPGGEVRLTVTAASSARLTVTKTGTGTVTSSPAAIDCGGTCSTLIDGTVILTARTSNGSGHVFTGWSVDGCKGPATTCRVNVNTATTVEATFAPVSRNLIFVSATKYPTNLGSAAAYDARCNESATAAGINDAAGTAFVAAISDAATQISGRLGSARGWARMDGKPFADTQLGLFMRGQVFNGIRFDEQGHDLGSVPTNTGAAFDYVTGALLLASGGTNACGDWTAISGMGMVGDSEGGAYAWQSSGLAPCEARSVVCMGKSLQAAVSPVVSTGKLIWITNTDYVPGSQTPDSKCMAELPAGVSTASALIGTSTRPGAGRIDPAANYVRVDGTLVGTGAQLIAGMRPESGVWQSADGNYATVSWAWTGSGTLSASPPLYGTCNDWTTSSVLVYGGAGRIGMDTGGSHMGIGPPWWTGADVHVVGVGEFHGTCDSPLARLYCLQP
jgi:hypothetical protein